MPVTPTLSSASFTSSSLNGLMIASIFFIARPLAAVESNAGATTGARVLGLGPNRSPRELDRTRGRAAVVGRRARPAHHLLDRGPEEARIGGEPLELAGMLEERDEPARRRVPRRVRPGGEEQR